MTEPLKLGQLIEGEAGRDAVHIAIAPVTAAEKLSPGQDIGFVTGSLESVSAKAKAKLGIVDPFLSKKVMAGDRFYMWLYPNTITSLRHEWAHPAFKIADIVATTTEKEVSEKYLKDIAEKMNMTFHCLMGACERWAESSGDYDGYTFMGENEGYKHDDCNWDEIWRHYQIVSGKVVPKEKQSGSIFSCSC